MPRLKLRPHHLLLNIYIYIYFHISENQFLCFCVRTVIIATYDHIFMSIAILIALVIVVVPGVPTSDPILTACNTGPVYIGNNIEDEKADKEKKGFISERAIFFFFSFFFFRCCLDG